MGGASTQLNHFSMAAGHRALFLCGITGSYYGGGSLPNSKNYVNSSGETPGLKGPTRDILDILQSIFGVVSLFSLTILFFFFTVSKITLDLYSSAFLANLSLWQTYRSHLDILDAVPSISEVGWDPVVFFQVATTSRDWFV